MRTTWARGALAAGMAVTAVAAAAAPVLAAGGPVAAAALGFTVRLDVGAAGGDDARICTGALVRPRVVVTATGCLVTAAHPDPASALGLPISARFASGATLRAADVRTAVTPELSAVVLSRPAPVAAVPLATSGASAGETLTAAGFGRTADAWLSTDAHAVSFVVREAGADGVALDLAEGATTGLCRGDAGAPLVRQTSTGYELVALATGAAQKGCLGETGTSGAATGADAAPLAALPAATADLFDQLTLSPVDSGRAPVAGAGFGTAVATGDFNKDGFPDIAVGSPAGRTGANADVASGTVTVFPGSAAGVGTGTVLLQSTWGAADEAGDQFGSALAAGDFNKDGYTDLAIGTPGELIGTVKAGAAAVFYGSATGLGKPVGIDQNDIGQTDVAGDLFGSSLTAADFNGDGYADLAIGTPGKTVGTAKSGQVAVLKGSASGVLKTSPWIVHQGATDGANEAGDLFGSALAAGNVVGAKTGTVYADLVVGVPGEAPGTDPRSGLIYIIPGSASGPTSGGKSATQSGNTGANEADDRFGSALAVADFNADGWADIAVGGPGEAPGTSPKSGNAYVIPGGSSVVGSGYALEERHVPGGENLADDLFGSAFTTGDLNADGRPDLIVGAPGRSGGAGVLHTFLGSSTGTLAPGSVITPESVYGTAEAGDRFGSALASADFNRDGRTDALVGVPGENAPGEPAAGSVVTLTRAATTP